MSNSSESHRYCKCSAYPWLHEFGLGDCDCEDKIKNIDVDEGDDYSADRRADDPRRGQAAGLNALRRIV
jgi:hypothetical protein